MFSGANDGAVCVYDILQNYLPIKYLSTSRPGFQVRLMRPLSLSLNTSEGREGSLSLVSVVQVLKFSRNSFLPRQILVACSPDGRLLATTSYEPGALTASLLIFHSGTLDPYMRIETTAPAFNNIQFNPSSTEIVAVSKVRIHGPRHV